MAKPPYLEDDCIKYYKAKDHSQKAKSLTYLASIFSLFIYISIFYVFNLSPYTLLNNNIFWFLMSNTLVLIIAADYGAFSSSKQKQDLYEEYVKHSQTRNYISPYVPKDEQVDIKKCINTKQELRGGEMLQADEEPITQQNSEIPERVLEIVEQNEQKKPNDQCSNEKKPLLLLQADDSYQASDEKSIPAARIYRRSKSERAKRVVTDERRNTVRRLETVKVEAKREEEENEFSKMTNEDLNRRVEEFIQKFNRQIRLQAMSRN